MAGEEREAFDKGVGVPGAYDGLVKAIGHLASAGVAFSGKIPASPEDVEQACATADWAMAQGATGVEFIWHGPKKWTPLQFQSAMGPRAAADMSVDMEEFIRNGQCHTCFDHSCFISMDGKITQCVGLRQALGDLHMADMGTVLLDRRIEEASAGVARYQVPACTECEFRVACTGCLVRTIQLRGSALSRHAACNYTPETATWSV
jgi:radical SAM protein with 4Fe4S-binding SPASM domain